MLGMFGKLLWRKNKTLGQTIAEYALIVALVAIASIGILKVFGKQLRSLYNAMTKQIAGQAGDSSFLGAATNALRHLAKLQGLYRNETISFQTPSAGATYVDWSRVTPDDLIAVRRIMTRSALPQEQSLNTTFTEEKE